MGKDITKQDIVPWAFVDTLAANVDNKKLTDKAFRELCRTTVPHVDTSKPRELRAMCIDLIREYRSVYGVNLLGPFVSKIDRLQHHLTEG